MVINFLSMVLHLKCMILDPSKLTKMSTILVLQKSVPGHIMPGVALSPVISLN
jgi:hypothetical protein